jgi:hypothetical protein
MFNCVLETFRESSKHLRMVYRYAGVTEQADRPYGRFAGPVAQLVRAHP